MNDTTQELVAALRKPVCDNHGGYFTKAANLIEDQAAIIDALKASGKSMQLIPLGDARRYFDKDQGHWVIEKTVYVQQPDQTARIEKLEGKMHYFRVQAKNGTLHNQVVIQNVDDVMGIK